MNQKEPILAEIPIEAAITRKLLERVPERLLRWRPHERSRTLGEIAAHVSSLPCLFLPSLSEDELDRASYRAATGTVAAILQTFDRDVAAALVTGGAS
ncbi:MAG: DinB family protein [Thermoanaerobaculia bacterium]